MGDTESAPGYVVPRTPWRISSPPLRTSSLLPCTSTWRFVESIAPAASKVWRPWPTRHVIIRKFSRQQAFRARIRKILCFSGPEFGRFRRSRADPDSITGFAAAIGVGNHGSSSKSEL